MPKSSTDMSAAVADVKFNNLSIRKAAVLENVKCPNLLRVTEINVKSPMVLVGVGELCLP